MSKVGHCDTHVNALNKLTAAWYGSKMDVQYPGIMLA